MMISLLFLAVAALPEQYTTKPGDTCDSVTTRFYGDVPGAIAHLHADNPTMGPPPHHVLATGTVLKLSPMPTGKKPVNRIMAAAKAEADEEAAPPPAPKAEPKAPEKPTAPGPNSDATLTFLVPQVERRPAAQNAWAEATINELLFRLDQVSTRKGAGAELTFNDTSRLQMRENALIVVLGAEKKGNVERKSSGFELVTGELKLAMAELRKTPMPVTLPGALMSTQARDAMMSVDAESTSRVCMYDGTASITAQGKSVTLKSNEGTRVVKGKAPEKPRPLPVQPVWANEEPILVMTADAETTLTLDLPPVTNAVTTRLEVAADQLFNRLGIDDASTAVTRTLKLAPGRYYARLSGIDAAGLQSRPSNLRRIEVLQLRGAVDHKAIVPAAVDAPVPPGYSLFDGDVEMRLPFLLVTPGKHVLTLRKLGTATPVSTVEVDVALPQPTVTVQPSGEGARVSALFDSDITGLPMRWVDAQTGTVLPEAKPVTREVAALVIAPAGATGTAELQYNGKGFASTGWSSGAAAPKGLQSEETPVAPREVKCATPYLLNNNGFGNAPWAYLDGHGCRTFELDSTLGVGSNGLLQSALGANGSFSVPSIDALRVQLAVRSLLTGPVATNVQVDVGVGYRFELNEHLSLGVSADLGGVIASNTVWGRGMVTAHSQFRWIEVSAGWGLAHSTALDNLRHSAFIEAALPIGEYFHLQAQANVDVPWLHMNRYKFGLAPGVSFHWNWLRISLAATLPLGWTKDGDPYQLLGGQLTVGYLH